MDDHDRDKDPLLDDTNENAEPNSECRTETRGAQKKIDRCITIEPVSFLYLFCLMPTLLLVEQYIYRQLSAKYNFTLEDNGNGNGTFCAVNTSDPHYILQQHIHSETSKWTLYLTICSTLPAVVATLWLGAYSDSANRKVALIYPLIGAILGSLMNVVVLYFNLPVPYLLVGGFTSGVFGGFATILMGSYSYAADVSTKKHRTLRIVIIELTITFAGSSSSIGTGYLIKSVGLLCPAIIVAVLHFVNLLYVWFILPESMVGDTTTKFCSLKMLIRPIQIYTKSYNVGCKRWILLLLLLIFFLVGMPVVADKNVTILFLQNTPLCFSVVLVSIYSALGLTIPSTLGLCATLFLQKKFKDIGLLAIGCVCGIASALLLAFSTNKVMVFIVPFVSSLMLLPIPMIRSIMSKMVEPEEQGSLFASIATVESLCTLFGTLLFNTVYAETTFIFGGAVFVVEAGLRLIALVLAGISYFLLRRYESSVALHSVNSDVHGYG